MESKREWLEFGKMFCRTLEMGIAPAVVTDDQDGTFCVVLDRAKTQQLEEDDAYKVKLEVTTSVDEWFHTPYEAMKFQYMNYVLNMESTVQETFNLDEHLLERLYELSDEEGIPLDEMVNDILSQHLIELDTEDELEDSEDCCGEDCDCTTACDNCSCEDEIEYRTVKCGEILQEDDEVYSNGEWKFLHPVAYGQQFFNSIYTIRRKVS